MCLALGPAVGLGLGRFAYALLVPAMRADLGWSYAGAGWMNTVNALGYLAGALLAAPISRRVSLRGCYVAGLVVVVLGIFATGVSENFFWLSGARLVTGLAGALAFVAGGAMAADLARGARRSSFVLGVYYAGTGLGLTLSGLLVPGFMQRFGVGSWPAAWIALGGVAAVLTALAVAGAGAGGRGSPGPRRAAAFSIRRNGRILAAYMIFGAGSIGYMTFMFAHLAEIGAGVVQLSGFWALIGLSAIAAPWIWTPLLARTRNGVAFAVLAAVTTLGAAIPLAQPGLVGAWASATVFGSSFFTIVAATTAYVRRNAPPGEYAAAIGVFTVAFGLGQAVGPFGAGAVADAAGALSYGLGAGCALIALAALIGASQRDDQRRD